MKAKKSEGTGNTDWEIAPAGTFPARLIRLIDLGEQYSEKYEKWTHKLSLAWELPTQVLKEEGEFKGQPHLVFNTYTNSMWNSNLKALVDGWIGPLSQEALDDLDLDKLVGQVGLMSVVHAKVGDKTYVNVGGLIPLPEGMDCPQQVGESIIFWLEKFDAEVWDGLSDRMKEKIGKSKDFAKSTGGGEAGTDSDPAPFPG